MKCRQIFWCELVFVAETIDSVHYQLFSVPLELSKLVFSLDALNWNEEETELYFPCS